MKEERMRKRKILLECLVRVETLEKLGKTKKINIDKFLSFWPYFSQT